MYDFLRATMGKIAPVDAFYIGFFRGDSKIVYPYTYDQEEYEQPGVHTFGPYGVSAWLLRHKKTYTYARDSGRLLDAGHMFGDTTRRSRDAVTVPLIDHGTGAGMPTVLGLAPMQSYTSGVYDECAVRAFEWICRSVVAVLRREREDADNLRELAAEQVVGEGRKPFTDFVVEVSDRLEAIRRAVAGLSADVASGNDVAERVAELDRMCRLAQQDVIAVLTRPVDDALDPLSMLTTREREVADLVGLRMTNREIAERLTISLPTVKTHVYNIMKKFGVRQRTEIIARIEYRGG